MAQTFRDALKPSAKHSGSPAKHISGYYPVLLMGKKIVWNGGKSYLKRDFGDDARRLAIDEAEAILCCDAGSLMAEQLQQAVKTGEPVSLTPKGNMEEGKLEFRPRSSGGYWVWSDTWSGTMECCGSVRRADQPRMRSKPWMAITKNGKPVGSYKTRTAAADCVLRT